MVGSSGPKSEGSRPPVAVVGTLMPHVAAERHPVYRGVIALALLAALIAAGLGSLSVALVLAAVALPAAVLVYIHDHRLWHDEPVTVIVVSLGLALLLGVGVGLLETYLVGPLADLRGDRVSAAADGADCAVGCVGAGGGVGGGGDRPAAGQCAVGVFASDGCGDGCSLSGAALSLGLSLVVQHGAFSHVQATSGDPAHVAFIALTLGFLQPIVLATAAMVAVLGIRRSGVNPVAVWVTRVWRWWWSMSWPPRCWRLMAPAALC